jgi:hypothetical protein
MTTQRRCRSSDYTTVGVNHGARKNHMTYIQIDIFWFYMLWGMIIIVYGSI